MGTTFRSDMSIKLKKKKKKKKFTIKSNYIKQARRVEPYPYKYGKQWEYGDQADEGGSE